MPTDTQPQSPEKAAKPNYKSTLNLPQTAFSMEAKLVQNEPKRLERWKQAGLYERLLEARAGREKWVLHDGPPFANGDIHIGHIINKTLKDVILRFRTMQGYQTPYVPGWDCHGLPIEHKIQEQFKGKLREMSTVEIRRHCHEYAQKYAALQGEQFQRLGILGDWADPYLTLRPGYEAQTLEVFARFVEAGLVYKQLKPVPWSVANQTALADAELEYQDVEDASVYVEFPIAPGTELANRFNLPVYFLVWTTTPWTLPANLAIAVGPKVRYAFIVYMRDGEQRVGVVAEELVDRVFKDRDGVGEHQPGGEAMTGEELCARAEYLHPFLEYKGRLLPADYVTTTDGTGLVHTAPGHGEDDYDTGVRHGLQVYSPVLANGRFDETVPEFLRGKTTKEGNALIADELRGRGRLFAVQNILHSYPHDWRSRTPIIFRATEQWFVSMEKGYRAGGSLRERAVGAVTSQVRFVPEWGRARILGMLQSRPDWCISRQRAWGLPIPVFYNEQGQPLLTPESVRAVAGRFAEKGSDAWFTDSPEELLGPGFAYPAGFEAGKLRKEKDIFDVWFESGSSWRAVLQARPELKFPADLYLEGSDQHRGWFQLSLLPSLGATGEAPFKQVLTHGFAVKPDGTKWSKRDQESNPDYPNAMKLMGEFGADVLRLWCCSMDYEGDMPASKKAVKDFGDKYRKIRNTLKYLLSNLYDFDPAKDTQPVPPDSLDGWVSEELNNFIAGVTAAYDAYELHRAFRLLHDFCAVQISAVYGNAMKDRLYCERPDAPLRRRCQTVMHRIALALTKLLAPMIVFTADEAWEHIPHKPAAEAGLPTVHAALLPEAPGCAASGGEVPGARREEWKLLLDLRDSATAQLDALKKEAGLNKALDAEVIYEVADADLRRRLEAYGADLEDLVGAGFHTVAEPPPGGPAASVRVVDRRQTYAACARSWKRRPDVGQDPAYPDLCARDAAAVKSAGAKPE